MKTQWIYAAAAAAILAGCGGSDTPAVTEEFEGVVSVGELTTCQLQTTAVQGYRVTNTYGGNCGISQSAYGLQGRQYVFPSFVPVFDSNFLQNTGSRLPAGSDFFASAAGALNPLFNQLGSFLNSFGNRSAYNTAPNMPGSKVATSSNGLMLGTIYEDFTGDGIKKISPLLAINTKSANPVTSLADASDYYNFIAQQCQNSPGTACTRFYGTVGVLETGEWELCVDGNLADDNPVCDPTFSGSGKVLDFANGKGTLALQNGSALSKAGTFKVFYDKTSGGKVVLLDLNGSTRLGRGGVYAASQVDTPDTAPASVWTYVQTDGNKGTIAITPDGRYTDTRAPGVTRTLQANQPWAGFVTTSNGLIVLPAGSGLFAAYASRNLPMSIGIKQ